jgi:hypothetical protein
VAPSSGL